MTVECRAEPGRLPPVVGRVAFFYCDEIGGAGGGDAVVGYQLGFDLGSIAFDSGDPGAEVEGDRIRGGLPQPDVEVGGDRHRQIVELAGGHDAVGGGPVHVAVEQASDNPAVDDTGERRYSEPEPVKIVVREMGILSWLRGTRPSF